ncbi:MAG: DUF3313 family protein [Halioglobus sp.]
MLVSASLKTMSVVASMLLLVACAGVETTEPAQTHDGLVLVPDTKVDAVYKKPGADLKAFSEFGIEPCEVAFKKNWLRDQNQSRIDLSSRVTQKDVDKIKDTLSDSCTGAFRESLLADPAYALVDNYSDGEAVLILRPSIINLDINAPDVRSTGMSRSYTTSAGEMTLSLELVDATTGEVLARVIDKKRGMDTGRMEWTSSVSNKADADRTLRRWAQLLRDGLDEARGI